MTKQMITQKELKELYHYDELTGVFTRRSIRGSRGRMTKEKVVGCTDKSGYKTLRVNYTLYYCHRLAWLYVYGEFPHEQIDHINGIRDDNRLCNIRSATRSENQRNMKLSTRNKSGVIGVSWFGRDSIWVVHTAINGKAKHIGRSYCLFEAACMSKSAQIKNGFHENHGKIL